MEDQKEETTRKSPTVEARELAKLINEIGIHDVARETGYSTGALQKMARDNETRPVIENWARLYREQNLDGPVEAEILICRVAKDKAKNLSDYVTLVLGGRIARFTDR